MISDSKLKIMLTSDDLKQFEINADELDYSNTETKRMFWDLLSQAKHDTGFDTDGQRVLVQLYPSKEGGCEMFVTKIGIMCSAEGGREGKYISSDSERTALRTKSAKRYAPSNERYSAFGFDRIEWMIGVCRRLADIGYIGESSAYVADNGRAYLFLYDVDAAGFMPLDEFSFIVEYGTPENIDSLRLFIGEHGRAICESNAVSLLGRL